MLPRESREPGRTQVELARSLAGTAGVPAGFDAARVRLAAAMLVAKRRRAVSRLMPELSRSLGADGASLFEEYARARAHPPGGVAQADALAFARWLRGRCRLSDAARTEILGARLHSGRRAGLARLAGPPLAVVIGVRLPVLGVRLLRVGGRATGR